MTPEQFKHWGEGTLEPISLIFAALLVLTLGFFACRAVRHRLTKTDWIVLGLTFVPSLLVLIQEFAVHREIVIFWRYHYPGYILALLPCAALVLALFGRWRRWAACAILLTSGVYALAGGINAIRHAVRFERHAADNWKACDEWAAEVIRQDWKGPARGPRESYDLDFYITDYRPLVFSHTSRTAYALHARTITIYRYLIAHREHDPDYFVLFDNELKDAESFFPQLVREKIAERKTRYGTMGVYRAIRKGGSKDE